MRKSMSAAVIAFCLMALLAGCEEDEKDVKDVEDPNSSGVEHGFTDLALAEGTVSSVDVVLTGEPDGDATVTFTSGDDTELAFTTDGGATRTASASLTFTADDWDVAQTVAVVALLDGSADGDVATSVNVSLGSSDEGTDETVTVQDVSGVQVTIPEPDADTVWEECFTDLFDGSGIPLTTVLSQCSGDYLMVACRTVGTTTLTVAAYAGRDDATFATPDDGSSTHAANGLKWYYNTVSNSSWGLLDAAGTLASGGTFGCDIGSGSNTRMCRANFNGDTNSGGRCGNASDTANFNLERVIYHAN